MMVNMTGAAKLSRAQRERMRVPGGYNRICTICTRRWAAGPTPISMIDQEIIIESCNKCLEKNRILETERERQIKRSQQLAATSRMLERRKLKHEAKERRHDIDDDDFGPDGGAEAFADGPDGI